MIEKVQLKGSHKGYKKGAVFQVWAGPTWVQTSSEYEYQYAYSPQAELESFGSTGRIKVEGHRTWVDVKKVR